MIDTYAHVESETIRAVAYSRRRSLGVWKAARTPSGLESDLTSLLAKVPRARIRARNLWVWLPPSDVCVKRLTGLPPIDADARLLRLVEQQTSRFFLHAHVAKPVVSAAVIDGQPTAALFDDVAVQAIQSAAATARMRLRAIAPSEYTAPVERDKRRAFSARRAGRQRSRTASLAWVPEANYRRTKLAIRSALSAAVGISLMLAIVAKGLRAELQLRASRAVIARLRAYEPALDSMETQLRRFEQIDEETRRFETGRRYATQLVGELASALPESTAVVSLKADSTGVTLGVLAGDVGGVVSGLLEAPYFTSAQIQGAVVEERVGDQRLERSTLRVRTRYSAVMRGRRP